MAAVSTFSSTGIPKEDTSVIVVIAWATSGVVSNNDILEVTGCSDVEVSGTEDAVSARRVVSLGFAGR